MPCQPTPEEADALARLVLFAHARSCFADGSVEQMRGAVTPLPRFGWIATSFRGQRLATPHLAYCHWLTPDSLAASGLSTEENPYVR